MEITLSEFCAVFARVSNDYREKTNKRTLYESICRAASRPNPDHRFLLYKDSLKKIDWYNAETELILNGILQDTILITGIDHETYLRVVVAPIELLFKLKNPKASKDIETWIISFILLERCFLQAGNKDV